MSGVVGSVVKIFGVVANMIPGVNIFANAALLAGSVGLEYLLNRKKKDSAAPELQTPPPPLTVTVSQPVAPRVWAYGRVRSAGVEFFKEANTVKTSLYSGIYLNDYPFDGLDAVICDDEYASWSTTLTATPTPPNNNFLAPSDGIKQNVGNPIVIIEIVPATENGTWSHMLGTMMVSGSIGSGSIADSNMSAFWDSQHQGHDVSCVYTFANMASSIVGANRQKFYPANWPSYSFVYRGSRVFDPRDASQSYADPILGVWTLYNTTWKWSENPALIAADFVNRLIQNGQLNLTGIDWAGIAEAANDCDALSPMVKYNFGGGSGYEVFARMTAAISLDAEPREVLSRIMAVCDGAYGIDQQGQFIMWIGKWEEPQITFTDSDISGFEENFGPEAINELNYMHTTYIEPRQNYQPVEAPIYQDMISQGQLGRRTGSVNLEYCPSPSQAWRMTRRHIQRQNGRRKLSVALGPRAMMAIGQRVVGVDAPTYGIQGAFRVMQLVPGDTLAEWSADLVEVTEDIFQDPAAPQDTLRAFAVVNPLATQTPSAPRVTRVVRSDGSLAVNIAAITTVNSWGYGIPDLTTLFADSAYQLDGRYSTDGGTNWTSVNVVISQFILQSGAIAAGSSVIAQIRFLPLSGTAGSWSASSPAIVI